MAGLRREANHQVPYSDEFAAQSRSERDRWSFYEAIIFLSDCFRFDKVFYLEKGNAMGYGFKEPSNPKLQSQRAKCPV
jgi:hypothetical protein